MQGQSSFTRPSLEHLEQRVVLSVDLSQFAGFLPDTFTALQEDGVDSQVFKAELPLIKDLLKESSTTPAQFLEPVADELSIALSGLDAGSSETEFLDAFNTGLEEFLQTDATRVSGDPEAGDAVEYQFTIGFAEAEALTDDSVSLARDLGLPGLGVSLESDVSTSLKVWYSMTVRFGADGDELYINTSTLSEPELDLNVEVEVADGSSLAGSLGVLQFDATNSGSGTELELEYEADLVDPGDGRLTRTEIMGGLVDFQTTVQLSAGANLDLTAGFGGSAINPSIRSDFVFDWDFEGELPELPAVSSLGGSVSANFEDVRMELQGGLYDGFVQPVLENIRQFTGPMEPIVDALNGMPLQEFGSNATFLDILGNFMGLSDGEKLFFETVSKVTTLANEVELSSDTGSIELGSFGFSDVRETDISLVDVSEEEGLANLASVSDSFSEALEDINAELPGDKGFRLDFLADPSRIFQLFAGDPNVTLFRFGLPDISYEFFDEITLFEVPIPPFGPAVTGELGIEGGFRIEGHLNLGYDGEGLKRFQTMDSDPSVLFDGFFIDTREPLLEITGWDGDEVDDNIISFFAGVNLGLDFSEFIEKTGLELPDWFSKAVDAGSPIDLTGEATVAYGLTGALAVGLAGDNDKLRASGLGDDCIFEIEGEVGLGGDVSVSADVSAAIPVVEEVINWLGEITGTDISLKSFSYEYERELVEFPETSIFEYVANCDAITGDGSQASEVENPVLAWLDPSDGTLRLNVGRFVESGDPNHRKINPGEINERYVVRHVSGTPGDSSGETVRVEAFGVSEEYSGVKKIVAQAGDGSDEITIGEEVLARSELEGGTNDDTLVTGAGGARLEGGEDNDRLIGGPAPDEIFGGPGNDRISGQAGQDLITAGPGDDAINGGADTDTLFEQADTDFVLSSSELTGKGSDSLNSIEVAELTAGSSANSFVVRQWNGIAKLFGLEGNDQYTIEILGSGDSAYRIQDSSGPGDAVEVRGTGNEDEFTVEVERVASGDEAVSYSGIEALTVDGGGSPDRINVRATAEETPTTIRGGDASDLVRVSSMAGIDDTGHVDDIRGNLDIEFGAGGANRLFVSNFSGTAAQPYILKEDADGFMSIRQMAPVAIRYRADGADGAFTLPGATDGGFLAFSPTLGPDVPAGFDPTYGVVIRGSDAERDTFLVQETIETGHTRVEGNGKNDSFQVASDAGTNNGHLNGIVGNLTVDGGAGPTNRLVISDFGGGANPDVGLDVVERDGVTLQRIRNFASVPADPASPAPPDDIFYTATGGGAFGSAPAPPRMVEAISSDPNMVIRSTAHGLSNGDRVLIRGAKGQTRSNGLFTVSVLDQDHFQIDVSGSDLYEEEYLGGGEWLPVQTDGVLLRGSDAGGDSFTVRANLPGHTMTLQGNGGHDTFQLGSHPDPVKDAPVVEGVNDGRLNHLPGIIAVEAGEGVDHINVNDHGSPVDPEGAADFNYLLTPTSLNSTADDPAAPPRTFGGIVYQASAEFLRLDGTDGVNVFDVKPSAATEYTINGNLPASGECLVGGGDYLRLDTTEPDITLDRHLHITDAGEGFWEFSGKREVVNFESIERFNHVDLVATATAFGSLGKVEVLDAETGARKFEIVVPYGFSHHGGINVATGDVNCDGLPDLLMVPEKFGDATLKVYDGSPDGLGEYQHELLTSFQVFPHRSFSGGASLGLGDVNHDGHNDVVVGAGPGSRPVVQVFDGGKVLTSHERIGEPFHAFKSNFRGGVNIAVGDLDNDGHADLAAASGQGGIPGTVNIYSGADLGGSAPPVVRRSLQPFGRTYHLGLSVAIGDFNADATRDLIVGAGQGSLPWVVAYNGEGIFDQPPSELTRFLAYSRFHRGGVNVATKPVHGGDPGSVEEVSLWLAPARTPQGHQVRQAHFTAMDLRPELVDEFFAHGYRTGVNIG